MRKVKVDEVKEILTEEEYGYITNERVSILKAKEKDLSTIVKLYNPTLPGERRLVTDNWRNTLRREDYNNCTFIIRDRYNKAIGLVALETRDRIFYNIDLWIPSVGKQKYLKHVIDTLVEWVENWTDISQFTLRKLTGCPKENRYNVIYENYKVQQD